MVGRAGVIGGLVGMNGQPENGAERFQAAFVMVVGWWVVVL